MKEKLDRAVFFPFPAFFLMCLQYIVMILTRGSAVAKTLLCVRPEQPIKHEKHCVRKQ